MIQESGNATIYNENGVFNMSGGKIVSNATGNNPYGVYVKNSTSSIHISGRSEIICNYGTAITISSSLNTKPIIGTDDGNINNKFPMIQGANNGIWLGSNIAQFYDGLIKGVKASIDVAKVETAYVVQNGVEEINNSIYNTAYLSSAAEMVASVNGTEYATIQEAINKVPKNNTETVITLLRSTREAIKVEKNQKVRFDLQNYIIANKGITNVIVNTGDITISNGSILSDTTQGAINNNTNGKLTITGGKIKAFGTRQAIYNDGGDLTISGAAYLSSTTSERATVQNHGSGPIKITGGTIISTGAQGLNIEKGTVTIGDNTDGELKTVPIIQGATYGVTANVNFNFYDGTLKGERAAINNESRVRLAEGYKLEHGTESTFKTAFVKVQ